MVFLCSETGFLKKYKTLMCQKSQVSSMHTGSESRKTSLLPPSDPGRGRDRKREVGRVSGITQPGETTWQPPIYRYMRLVSLHWLTFGGLRSQASQPNRRRGNNVQHAQTDHPRYISWLFNWLNNMQQNSNIQYFCVATLQAHSEFVFDNFNNNQQNVICMMEAIKH